MEQVKKVFPYGNLSIEFQQGGMRASSGIAVPELGDKVRWGTFSGWTCSASKARA